MALTGIPLVSVRSIIVSWLKTLAVGVTEMYLLLLNALVLQLF